MAYWEFLDYITEDRQNPVLAWWGTLSDQAKAEFDTLVLVLSETEDWDEPKRKKRKYKELDKQHKGLSELILKVDGKNLRPIGLLRKEQRQFVFLGGCEKHTFWTVPPGAFDKALRLKEKLDQGKGATGAHV
jgi:hypothetical protein